MYTAAFLVLLGGMVNQTVAHYLFGHLIINGTKTPAFEYVRDVDPPSEYIDSIAFGKTYPLWPEDLDSANFTCGRNAWLYASNTSTATVMAGSQVGMGVIPQIPSLKGKYDNIFHEGPGLVYMAPLKGKKTLEEWTGEDGEWFKIAEWGFLNATAWVIQKWTEVNFTIPLTTPPGKYLLRMEHFTFSPSMQWYVNCAHIDVVGPGGGNPTGFAKFPGTYVLKDIRDRFYKEGWSRDYRNFSGFGEPPVWRG
ncbi:uncharacterized protein EI97DRAFT_482708 [Westerdykella ornata]|uniref:lytic cellulose monooxygenase (C4-dehydrogenating) n=1 Tax=Westerdykella ornata TaxID=318751 RepID=A0A6A6J9N0_WESOR|nr:uncharacterized protein EI97DRAFT_482708 [Westerdykella ornata]KAF2273092.1 hypothetical protein EI97DRAFT_482708 [Westerdykella ornata]